MKEIDLFPLHGKMMKARLWPELENRMTYVYPAGFSEEQLKDAEALMAEMEKEYPLTMADFE